MAEAGASTALGGALRLISDIPPELSVGDLRDFFRDAVESGDFLVFHYTKRQQPIVESAEESDELSSYLRKEWERDRHRAGDAAEASSGAASAAGWRGCVLVRLRNEAVAASFEQHYHGARWLLGRSPGRV